MKRTTSDYDNDEFDRLFSKTHGGSSDKVNEYEDFVEIEFDADDIEEDQDFDDQDEY